MGGIDALISGVGIEIFIDLDTMDGYDKFDSSYKRVTSKTLLVKLGPQNGCRGIC